MRLLLIAVVAAAALWSGYWWFGSRAVETGLRGWLDGRADVGWTVSYGSVHTRGFPNRFDTTIDELELANPAEGFAWSAPLFQILRLSYRPNHVIVVWPEEQTFETPDGHPVTVTAGQARASLVLRPGVDLDLDRATAVFEDIRLESSAGWSAEAAEGTFAVRASEEAEHDLKLGMEVRGIRPESALWGFPARGGADLKIPASVKLDADLGFDSAWNRHAMEHRRPVLTAVSLKTARAAWGDLELRATGDLTVDAAGSASGNLTVEVRNWQEILRIAVAGGLIPEDVTSVLEAGAGLLGGFSAESETLEVPLTFRSGYVSVGLFPLGRLGPLLPE